MKLADALQRVVVEEVRDTKRGVRGLAPAPTIVRPRFREQALVWWVRTGVPARVEVVEARLRVLKLRVLR